MERLVKLGVVIVHYRRPDLLIGAVNSLETVHRSRFFVVDNSKGSRSLAACWNLGVGGALEWGAERVLVSNDDVVFHPCTVDHLVERSLERGYGFVSPADVRVESGLDLAGFLSLAEPADGLDRQAANFSCFLLSPDLFREVGPFDENFYPAYYEDADYNLRLGLAGRHGMLTTYAPYFHYGGAGGGVDLVAAERNRAYLLAKWKDTVPWIESFATTGGLLT